MKIAPVPGRMRAARTLQAALLSNAQDFYRKGKIKEQFGMRSESQHNNFLFLGSQHDGPHESLCGVPRGPAGENIGWKVHGRA